MKIATSIAVSALLLGMIGAASAETPPASLKIEPAALSFGKVRAGRASVAQDVVLLNPTNAALSIKSVTTSGPFTVTGNTCGSSLAPGHSCQISVTFHPAARSKLSRKAQKGTLTIIDSASNSPQVMKLAGSIASKSKRTRNTAQAAALASAGLARPTGIAVDSDRAIFVANSSTDTVTIYAIGSDGVVAPISSIGGPNTGLAGPNGVALDSSGTIYVANVGRGAPPRGSITIYPADADGDVAPTATIAGANTGLDNPQGVALDSSGNIYVANAIGGASRFGSVTAYPAGSDGNVAPTTTVGGPNTGLAQPSGIALDGSGNIFVANTGGGPSHHGSITAYRAGATGDVTPIATLSGANTGLRDPEGIAIDSSGNVLVANFNGNSVTIYAAGGNGNVSPALVISGAKTGLAEPTGLALDGGGNIYVTDEGVLDRGPYSVTVYGVGGSGNIAPIADISGAPANLDAPKKIAGDPLR